MPELYYPHEVDDPEKRAALARDPRLFTMQPTKDNQIGDNYLLFLAFFVNRFELFSQWPQFYNYYLTLHIHYVKQEDGTNAMVACPKKANYHAGLISRTSPVPMPFPPPNDRCGFCAHAQKYWDVFDELKKKYGLDKMTKEGYRFAIQQHADAGRARELGRHWSSSERFYFGVFDMAKATGRKPLEDTDEGVVRIQGCFGPKRIFTDLELKRSAGRQFWDVHGGNAREVLVRRDNSNSARFCEYSLEVSDRPLALSPELLEYLKGGDVPDPFTWVKIWPAERVAEYIAAQQPAEREYAPQTQPPQAQPAPVAGASPLTPPPSAPAHVGAQVGAAAPPVLPGPGAAPRSVPAAPPPPAAPPVGAPPPVAATMAAAPPPPAGAAPPAGVPLGAQMGEPPTAARRGKLKWR